MTDLAAVVFDGVVYSSWLFMMAAGLTLIYGVMKILNIAHGSLYALGAYVGASLVGAWLAGGYPPVGSYALLLVAALLVGLVAGPLLERGLLRLMYGRDEVVLLLVTYAVFLILEDVTKLAWGVESLVVAEPYALPGNFHIGTLAYPVYNLILIGAAVVTGLAVAWGLYRVARSPRSPSGTSIRRPPTGRPRASSCSSRSSA